MKRNLKIINTLVFFGLLVALPIVITEASESGNISELLLLIGTELLIVSNMVYLFSNVEETRV